MTADQFVEWVILADNDNPNVSETSRVHTFKQELRAAFIDCMGEETVDANRLRYSESNDTLKQ